MSQNKSTYTIKTSIRAIDVSLSLLLILALLPTWIFQCLRSVLLREPVFFYRTVEDAAGRTLHIPQFTRGPFTQSLILLSVLRGRLQLCGASITYPLEREHQAAAAHLAPGVFSVFDTYQWTGLIDRPHHEVLAAQSLAYSPVSYCKCLAKIIITYCLYANNTLRTNKVFAIFGIRINNLTLQEALAWIFAKRTSGRCEVGFFVNVHSVNIAVEKPAFKNCLNRADCVFADGSGVRMAAAHLGEKLLSNLNGTDLLPHICRLAAQNNQSIYFLGSEAGIAQKAAENLQATYPGMRIAGSHHGYFKAEDNAQIIAQINQSGADICLVAMGSPVQEQWLLDHANQLQCATALAVGGLFDFYSGKIPRAPRWLRELGFEWVWRLIQEPGTKFKRYVIGNPVFLFRTFVMNQARG
jgi:N-acetylglucosaminyldiphosphoundecaprenol N-acetyl-beta-D-mannosaminyltransferase